MATRRQTRRRRENSMGRISCFNLPGYIHIYYRGLDAEEPLDLLLSTHWHCTYMQVWTDLFYFGFFPHDVAWNSSELTRPRDAAKTKSTVLFSEMVCRRQFDASPQDSRDWLTF
jgi:hypothetical protein